MRINAIAALSCLITLAACSAASGGGIQQMNAAGLQMTKETRTGLVSGTASASWDIGAVVLRACGTNARATDFNIIPATDQSGGYEFYFRCN